MSTFFNDIKFGIRQLIRNPGFSAVVVLILAVGIGATTAVLSVADAVMFRPCPYKDPDRLVCVYETKLPERTNRLFTSLVGFRDWRQQNHVFEQMVGAHQWNGIVRVADRAEHARGFFVSQGFFPLLGATAMLGRTFTPEDHGAGGRQVVVLSHDHWRHWFGGDPDVIGKTMILDDQVYTIVGVLSQGFRWVFQGLACGLWVPLSPEALEEGKRNYRTVQAIGRLRAGVSPEQAQAQMDLIADRLAQAYPDTHANYGIQVTPINEAYAQHTASSGQPRTLLILLGVVVAVLLISCMHVTTLLIARSATREQEIAVRAALGAHRLRIVRQLLTESVLLAACAGLLGLSPGTAGPEAVGRSRGSLRCIWTAGCFSTCWACAC